MNKINFLVQSPECSRSNRVFLSSCVILANTQTLFIRQPILILLYETKSLTQLACVAGVYLGVEGGGENLGENEPCYATVCVSKRKGTFSFIFFFSNFHLQTKE